jgi:hypothetical protein
MGVFEWIIDVVREGRVDSQRRRGDSFKVMEVQES